MNCCSDDTVRLKASWRKCKKTGETRQLAGDKWVGWLVDWLGGERDSETQALQQRDAAEAQGKKAGAQQVPQGRQVGDGEVVRVQAPPPHQADDEVGDVEEDGHLEGKGKRAAMTK